MAAAREEAMDSSVSVTAAVRWFERDETTHRMPKPQLGESSTWRFCSNILKKRAAPRIGDTGENVRVSVKWRK